jgi:hypothetical protein
MTDNATCFSLTILTSLFTVLIRCLYFMPLRIININLEVKHRTTKFTVLNRNQHSGDNFKCNFSRRSSKFTLRRTLEFLSSRFWSRCIFFCIFYIDPRLEMGQDAIIRRPFSSRDRFFPRRSYLQRLKTSSPSFLTTLHVGIVKPAL